MPQPAHAAKSQVTGHLSSSEAVQGCQGGEGGVVEAGLPLVQVVHEQVADGTAGQVVAVDEPGGG